MVLGSSDESGRASVSPVYYAPVGYGDSLWVSRPEARHSQNLSARSDLRIVIFDSTVPIDTGRAVYMSAVAEQVPIDEVAETLDPFSRRVLAHGGGAFTVDDVQAPAHLRLYRATTAEHYILDERDRRVRVSP